MTEHDPDYDCSFLARDVNTFNRAEQQQCGVLLLLASAGLLLLSTYLVPALLFLAPSVSVVCFIAGVVVAMCAVSCMLGAPPQRNLQRRHQRHSERVARQLAAPVAAPAPVMHVPESEIVMYQVKAFTPLHWSERV